MTHPVRRIGRILGRALLALGLLAGLLLAPVLWIETACRPGAILPANATPLLPPEVWRLESRTLLTYPEWHIVHAYDDLAAVMAAGDPQDFGFFRAVRDFWSSFCTLNRQAGAHGGADVPTRQMIHTIGVSFTVEMAMKAAYEESLGRLAVWVRGPVRAPLDDLAARQAADYARFLQQTPWYRRAFDADRQALSAAPGDSFRDHERRLALGLEYTIKAAYARLIGAAVAGMPPDALTMHSVVDGLPPAELAAIPGLRVIGPCCNGATRIETPRYRAFTELARVLAARGARFVEIAGNDQILLTAISDQPRMTGAIHSLPRQGNPGYRHLVLVPVGDLAARLRDAGDGARIEHIHDY